MSDGCCNSEYLLKQIDMLDQKVDGLRRTVDALSANTEDHPAHSRHTRWRLSHVYRPERRSRRLSVVQCELLARHILNDQIDTHRDWSLASAIALSLSQ